MTILTRVSMALMADARGGLLLLGGGGHCLSVLDALGALAAAAGYLAYGRVAIVDLPEKAGTDVLGFPVVGADGDLGRLRDEYDTAFVSLGSMGDWSARERLRGLAARYGYALATVIHPSACVSGYAALGEGVFAGMRAAVNAASTVGDMCILNTGCVVEHGCTVGQYAHIAPGAVLCGGVRLGAGSHIGAASVVRQGLEVGANAVVGAGSVVTRNIPDGVVAFGNPCRIIRKNERA